jgi:hypothetical protein
LNEFNEFWFVKFVQFVAYPLISLRGLSFPADFNDADGLDNPVGRRDRESSLGHELPNQIGGVGPAHSRLHSDAHEAIGVVECLPGVAGIL